MVSIIIAAVRSGAITDSILQSAGDYLSVNAQAVSAQEAEHLKNALLVAFRQEQNPSRAAVLSWALGKSRDPGLKEVYLEHLQRLIKNPAAANAGIHQILIALDNLGEAVLERNARGRSSQSLSDVEKNLRQARAYLAKQACGSP